MAARHVIVFRSRLRPGVEEAYARRAAAMYAIAVGMPGLVSSKDFVADDGERVAVIEFESAEALRAWREHPEHVAAQQEGRDRWYATYSIQVCVIERASAFDAATGAWTRFP